MQEKTDAELVSLARQGDNNAFDRLVIKYQDVAHRFAIRIVQDVDLAKDITQEAAIKAYQSIHNLQEPAKFKNWLCGIIWNVSRSYIRNQISNRQSLTSNKIENTDCYTSSQIITEQHEEQKVVIEAVEGLAKPYKEVILMFYFQQLNINEIAVQLAISLAAVKVRLNRARKQVKDNIIKNNPEIFNERRRQNMVKVTVADVMKQESKDNEGHSIMEYAMVLKEENGERALPIWIGPSESTAIAVGIGKLTLPRPMTFDFIANLLQALDAKIEKVAVTDLKESTFYGTVQIKYGNKTVDMDARPSDAVALSVKTGSPIFVEDKLFEIAGVNIPKQSKELKAKSGVTDILEDIKKYIPSGKVKLPTKKERMTRNKKLLTSIYQS